MSKAPTPSAFIFACCLAVCCLLACQTPKNTAYFQTIKRDTTLQNLVTKNGEPKIVPDDLLAINITSASTELSALYNGAQGVGSAAAQGYLVDKNGNIQLFKLGEQKLAGLTRAEAKEKLQKALEPYLKDPVVTIRFANHRVTFLGEVGSPGVLVLNNEGISLIEAIGERGDLTENARADNILVIRKTENGKDFKHLSLLDHSVFTSPYFYLQNEDVVYVEPVAKKADSMNTQQVISYVLTGISLVTLILSRIK